MPRVKVVFDPGLGYRGEVYLGDTLMYRGRVDHDGPGTARLQAERWSKQHLEVKRLYAPAPVFSEPPDLQKQARPRATMEAKLKLKLQLERIQ